MGSETLDYYLWTVVLVLLCTKMTVSRDHAEYYTVYACDGKMLKIECKDNYVINLIRANYGRYSITVCNDNGSTDWSVNCMSHRSSSILQGRCGSKQNCSVAASTSLFDDPCPGTVKYLEAHYTCVSATSPSSTSRSNPPWLITSPPSVWTTVKSFVIHSETSTAPSSSSSSSSSSSTTLATTSSSVKAVLKEEDLKEVDEAIPNTLSPFIDSLSESEVAISYSTSREVFSTSEIPMPDHDKKVPMCRPTFIRNLPWNWTFGGDVSVQPCPVGAVGYARWRCQIISDDLAIRFPDTPDLSECRSVWLNNLESRISEQDSTSKIAADLCQVTESKMLFGGDMGTTVKIISDLAHKMQADLQTFPDYHQREAMVSELFQSTAQVSSNLLDMSQQASWKDLSYKEQMRVASFLLIGLEENSFLLAETVTQEKVKTLCLKNILLSVRVLKSKNVDDERFPTFSELDNCKLKVDNWLQLYKSPLLENSDSGLVRLVYTAFDTLEQVLKVQPNSKEEKMINSKVLSASLGKRRHIQLSQPVILCLQHLHTENISNPTCVFWDYTQNQWSEEGCSLVTTNKTHSICRCSHLTSFAIMVDVQPSSLSLASRSISLLTLILLLVVLLILLLVSVFLVTRYMHKQQSSKEYGAAVFVRRENKWFHKCFGCCQRSNESEKTLSCKEPRPALYSNASVQSMASVLDNSGATICATHIVPHTSNTMPRSYMAENALDSHYSTSHLRLNYHYPTYGRNGSIRKMREACRLEHLENTLQHRNKKLTVGSLRSNSPRSHTYSEIAATSQRSDPVYEEIEREREHCSQISDISDEDAKRNSDMSRQSSKSYSDHRPLIPYNAVTDRNFHAALDAAYRQQLMEHSARTVSVLDGQTVVCHLHQSDPRVYHKSIGHVPPHYY